MNRVKCLNYRDQTISGHVYGNAFCFIFGFHLETDGILVSFYTAVFGLSQFCFGFRAIFYEEGKDGENYRKKNKFRCHIDKEQRSLLKLKNTVR